MRGVFAAMSVCGALAVFAGVVATAEGIGGHVIRVDQKKQCLALE